MTASSHPSDILAAGTQAPDFNLPATPDQRLRLSELRGKPVVLVFYPADWSPVCGDELALFNEALPLIKPKQALDFTLFDVTQLGQDLRLRLRPAQVTGAA